MWHRAVEFMGIIRYDISQVLCGHGKKPGKNTEEKRNHEGKEHTPDEAYLLLGPRSGRNKKVDFQMFVGTDFGAKKDQAMSTFVRLQM